MRPPRDPRGVKLSTERFTKEERLRRRKEYLAVQGHGRKIHLGDLLVVVCRREKKRVGLTVSKKVGGAVQRNRVKRLLREIWRRKRDLIPGGFELVFIAKQSAVHASYETLLAQFQELARRLRR
jgi:ribonuclease P protein component